MEKCTEEREAWREAQAEVECLQEAVKAADAQYGPVNTPVIETVTPLETREKVEQLRADLEAAEERLTTTERVYRDCQARSD